MIRPCISFADAVLHKSRQRRQYADGLRIKALTLKRSVQNDLTLGDIAREVGYRVCDIVVRHGENGDLSYGTRVTVDHTCTLIQRSKVGVQISGITLTAGISPFEDENSRRASA